MRILKNFSSSIVVFLVALPLCLGIAQGSEVHAFAGIIAGIIGGIVVGLISQSHISVAGPAAGLITIVIGALENLKTFEIFLLAVVIAGLVQIILGILKWGEIAEYVPLSVIKGMMAAIGIILILKQIPHLVGYDQNFSGDEDFIQSDGRNTFTELLDVAGFTSLGTIIVGLVGLLLMFFWGRILRKSQTLRKFLPAPLIVVLVGIGINILLLNLWPVHAIGKAHLVDLPMITGITDFASELRFPDFGAIGNSKVWILGGQIALVASLESLLCLEAAEKLDPQKRIASPNRELIAQGVGNTMSGLLGGLPITGVVVRSSANANAGATSKMSTIFHGIILALAVTMMPGLLNLIPKAALAAILIYTGYKLANVALLKEQFIKGMNAFIPFAVTVVAIILSNLLVGVVIGIVVGLIFVLKSSFKLSVVVVNEGSDYLFRFGEQVQFFNKAAVKRNLERLPDNAKVIFDFTNNSIIDPDIMEMLIDFRVSADARNIHLEFNNPPLAYRFLANK